MFNKHGIKKIIALVLTVIMLFGMETAAFADEANNSSALLSEALEARKKGLEGSDADWNDAAAYLDRLSPTELVHYYAAVTGGYYYDHYLDTGFKFFNASLYLAMNPDVAASARESKTDQFEYAVKQYITEGILFGRASQTDFDPVIAILLNPDMARKELARKDFEPDYLFRGFCAEYGHGTTHGYYVLYSKDKDGIITLYLALETQPGSQSGIQPSSPEGKGGRNPNFKNSLSNIISPYSLYRKDSSSTESVDLGGTYFGNNYQLIKDNLTDKYTLMIYICASDQEKPDYRRQTIQLMELVAADSDNLNILICAGGCAENTNLNWKNNYFANNIPAGKTGIYYLDKSKISSADKDAVKAIEAKNDNTALYNMVAGDQALDIDKYLNENTLVPMVYTDKVDFGDPALLTGFMNLASDLFPADDYGLILSNHGGGIIGGVCSSGQSSGINATSLSDSELESALGSSKIFAEASKDGKLGILFMDACLMSTGELAYSLSDYYRYLIASEEMTTGHTDYVNLINSVNSAAGGKSVDDGSLARKIADKFESSSWHNGQDNFVGSLAVFDSDSVANFTKRIDDVGGALADLLTSSSIDALQKSKNFEAIYKSVISGYVYFGLSNSDTLTTAENSLTGTVDIGEFLSYLKVNLTALNSSGISPQNKALVDKALSTIESALNSGMLTYTRMNIWEDQVSLSKDGGGTVISMKDTAPQSFWTDLRGNNSTPYGVAYLLPRWSADGALNSDYEQGFKDSGLSQYIRFLQAFVNYQCAANGDGGKILISLKNELINKQYRLYTGLVSSVSKQKAGSSASYLKFDIPGSYAAGAQPQDSFGSPIADFVALSPATNLLLVHRAVIDGKDYNMVCAQQNVPAHLVSVNTNSININTNDITSMTSYIVSGLYSGEAQDSPVHNQYVILSDLSTQDKLNLVKTMKPSVTEDDLYYYYTVFGTSIDNDGNKNLVYHVFEAGQTSNSYIGTGYFYNNVAFSSGVLANPVFAHYVINESGGVMNYHSFDSLEESTSYVQDPAKLFTSGVELIESTLIKADQRDADVLLSEYGFSFSFDNEAYSAVQKLDSAAYASAGNVLAGPGGDSAAGAQSGTQTQQGASGGNTNSICESDTLSSADDVPAISESEETVPESEVKTEAETSEEKTVLPAVDAQEQDVSGNQGAQDVPEVIEFPVQSSTEAAAETPVQSEPVSVEEILVEAA